MYFELLPENDGNGWRNGMLRVDTPSGSVHLQTPAGTGSPYLYQVDFTANAATSTISFVNYSRLAIDDNWCDPLTTAWCTIDGLSTTPKTSEPMIDNVVVALESACVTSSNTDYGDAPDTAANTGAGNYKTLASDGGASHTIIPSLSIGNTIDGDSGTLQNTNADADDNSGSPDDEDGLQNPAIISTTTGQTYTLTTYVKNETGSTAYLTAYIDFNRDGDFLDAGERADTQHVYWNGYMLSNFTVPAGTTAGTTYARLRLSQTRAEAETSVGAATSGEVEDHKLTISAGPFYDFGDAPATYGDARHTTLNSLFLGENRPDAETASQYSYNAIGDGVDEDGSPNQYNNPYIALFPILKMTATSYSVDVRTTNTTGNAGKLYGWIDFDGNGVFNPDEAASVNVPNNTNGNVTLTWNSIPTDIKLGTTFIRLRLTTDAAVTTSTPANNASNGEVEDYPIAVAIDVPPDSPDVTIVRGENQACSSTIFTDNFDDLASEQYFGANTSATPFVIRNWTATGGGNDTYARTVEVSPFAATQGRSIYFGNGMMRRFYPDTGGVLAFDGNGRMLSPPDAVELRDNADDVSPGVNIHESDWGLNPLPCHVLLPQPLGNVIACTSLRCQKAGIGTRE
ncbi:GEVED domain-containing protein [Thiothrix subterranea]|uniref:GEVED domain-containing protein n=1 Tax=Thiothrix subterranea TaxID=2735563 RepID=UPI00280B0648|nr:GEVED domain-containing protein [Thiothrix subterranea]